VDVHFTTEVEESELVEKVAVALATLDFEPQFEVTRTN
jgi:hypothetical protein